MGWKGQNESDGGMDGGGLEEGEQGFFEIWPVNSHIKNDWLIPRNPQS